MDCSACGHTNTDEARYCGHCGAALAKVALCPNCEARNPLENAYCNACGHALAESDASPRGIGPGRRSLIPDPIAAQIRASRTQLEGERKWVTILFVDVVGSTKLAQRAGPERWQQTMERFFRIICNSVHRYQGIIDRFTGDGAMAVFGAPLADEHHALHAGHAALELSDELAGLSAELRRKQGLNLLVRLGLNSGEVIVGTIGEKLDIKYTAVGPTVALAKRMEGLAEPGKIYLTQTTAAQVRGYFRLRELGMFDVKGSEAPVTVYELAGLGSMRTALEVARQHGFSPFLGREQETQALHSALARARAGNGQVVCVAGEAGVGKSRLLYEFAKHCRRQRIEVWEGHCRARGETLALMPLLELLRTYFGIDEQDASSVAREKIAGQVLLLDPKLDNELPLLFELLGIADPHRSVVRMDPEARQRRLFAMLNQVLAARNGQSAVVFVLEDLQWIDPGSGAFLDNLIDALPGTRTLVLTSFRPPYQADWMQRSYCGRIALAPLAADPSRQLVDDLLGNDPSLDRLRERIGTRAGGNPFFIEELVRGLVDGKNLVGERGAYQLVGDLDGGVVPAAVQVVIAARIDRLPEREKQLLQSAAVIGRQFAESLVVEVAGISPPEARVSLRALLDVELIYKRTLSPERGYSFVHQLTAEVAYSSQLTESRARLHARTAAALEELYPERLDELAALISHHHEQAADYLPAAEWGARAAVWAGFADLMGAIRQWHRVSELSDDAPESSKAASIGIWSRIAIMWFGAHLGADEREIRQAFEQARALAERSGDVRSLAMVLGRYAWSRVMMAGEPAAYVDMALESVRLAQEADDPAMQVAMNGAPVTLFFAGRLREGLEITEPWFAWWAEDPTLGTGVHVESPYAQAIGMCAQTRLFVGEVTVQEARAEAERGLALALEHFDPETAIAAYLPLETICFFEGDGEAALDFACRAVELADRAGSVWEQISTYAIQGSAYIARGEFAEAIAAEMRSLELARRGILLWEPFALAQLAMAYTGAGEFDRARKAATEAVDLAAGKGSRFFELTAQLALGGALITAQAAAPGGTPNPASVNEIETTLARIETLIEDMGATAFEPWLHELRARLGQLIGDISTYTQELQHAQQEWTAIGSRQRADALSAELRPAAA